MAKGKAHLGSKNFFTLVVLSVSALSLMFVTYASQQKTNTKSDAAGGCLSKAPLLKPLDTTKGENYIVYKYTITNLCNTRYDYTFNMGAPGGWRKDYRENSEDWEKFGLFLSGSIKAKGAVTVRARIFPSENAVKKAREAGGKKTFKFDAEACNFYSADGTPVMGDNCDTSPASYTVTVN